MKYYVRKPIGLGLGGWMLHLVGSATGWIYKMAFGGFDELAYRKSRKRFIAEIEENFSNLLSRHSGHVVPDEGLNLPRAFDYVAVTCEFKEVRFRIIRGRGELRIQAALPGNPQDWQELSLLWHRKAMRECGSPPSCNDPLCEVAQRTENNWDQIVVALAAWQ